jgi:hypothetical protein
MAGRFNYQPNEKEIRLCQMTQQPEVMIGHAMDRFDQEGNLTDVVTKEFIIGLLQNLAEWTRRIAPPQRQ